MYLIAYISFTHLLFLTVFTIVTNLTVFSVCMFYCSKFAAKLTVFRHLNTHLFEATQKSELTNSKVILTEYTYFYCVEDTRALTQWVHKVISE